MVYYEFVDIIIGQLYDKGNILLYCIEYYYWRKRIVLNTTIGALGKIDKYKLNTSVVTANAMQCKNYRQHKCTETTVNNIYFMKIIQNSTRCDQSNCSATFLYHWEQLSMFKHILNVLFWYQYYDIKYYNMIHFISEDIIYIIGVLLTILCRTMEYQIFKYNILLMKTFEKN